MTRAVSLGRVEIREDLQRGEPWPHTCQMGMGWGGGQWEPDRDTLGNRTRKLDKHCWVGHVTCFQNLFW